MTYDEWVEAGRDLQAKIVDARFKIGDWVNVGYGTFGAKDVQAAARSFGWSDETLRVYSWVASSYGEGQRHHRVSFSHYQHAAPLPAHKRDELLARSERDGLSLRELRQLVRGARTNTPLEPVFTVAIEVKTEADVDRVVRLLTSVLPTVSIRVTHPSRVSALQA